MKDSRKEEDILAESILVVVAYISNRQGVRGAYLRKF
jgi:hypothetical protein